MENDFTLKNENAGFYISAFFLVAYAVLFWSIIVRQRLTNALTTVYKSKGPSIHYGLNLLYWGSPFFFLALWGIASYTGLVSSRSIPTPGAVGRALWILLTSGALALEAVISFQRVIVGFLFASLIGVSLGLAAGAFVVGRQLIRPINSFLRYIPPTAFIVLLIVYFGVGEAFKYAVVFLGIVFFIVQMVVDVVDDVDTRFIEIALTSGLSNREVFKQVILPFSWPRIFDVLRINLSAGWTFLVAAELIGSERGLGHFIAVSQRFLRLDDVYSGILMFGVIGLLTDFGLELLSHKMFRWYYVALKR